MPPACARRSFKRSKAERIHRGRIIRPGWLSRKRLKRLRFDSSMPFWDPNQFTRAPGFAERWLRRVFIEDWSLKLLALAITLILWFVVSGHDVEREVTVQPSLEGKPAPAYEVKSVTTTPNQVRVQGPVSSVNAAEIKGFTEKISINDRRERVEARYPASNTADLDGQEATTDH